MVAFGGSFGGKGFGDVQPRKRRPHGNILHRLMDRIIGADQELGPRSPKLEGGRRHQVANACDVAAVKTANAVAERMRVHRHLGMGVRTKVPRTLRADGPVAQRGIFGRARDDADVFGHGQPFSPCRT